MIKKVRKRYAALKGVMVALLFVFVIALLASWYFSAKLKPIAQTRLKELVLQATDSLYRIEFSDISLNLLIGGATLSDVRIIPDTVIYRKLIARKKAPNNLYYVTLDKLSIRHFHPVRLLRDKKLEVDQLIFDHPDVVMINKQLDFNEARLNSEADNPYHYISRYLKALKVETISLKDIRFKYVNNNRLVQETDSIANLNITLKDWRIDAFSAADKSRLYLLKDVIISLNDYNYATPDSMYHINLNQLDFRASSGKLNIKTMRVVPRYSEMEFGKAAGYGRDRFNIGMSDLSLEGIDLPLYVRKQELYAKEMNIANGFVEVFNNNTLPRKDTVKTGRYPHQLLQKVKEQLTIKQLNLNNIDFSYAEYDKESGQKGKITFERTSGTFTNITNTTKAKKKNPYLFANLTTYLMGRGKLDVKFRFDLLAKDGSFNYSGILGAMDGSALNRITRPLGMVEIRRGKVKRLEFDISANDRRADGEMNFAFNELSVSLFKREREQLVRKGFMSLLANAMVINPDNPNAAGVLIKAPVHYERVKTASFFNLIWRSLFQGIKYSVGITPAKEKKIREQIARFEKIKTDRDKRRAARQKRRALQSGGR